jgi:hypothetical protein
MEDGGEMVSEEEEEEDSDCILNERGSLKQLHLAKHDVEGVVSAFMPLRGTSLEGCLWGFVSSIWWWLGRGHKYQGQSLPVVSAGGGWGFIQVLMRFE